MSTVGIDPRQGLHKNLDLLSAYNLFQKDWPLYKPARLYTSAINSPLFRRIEETLTDQSKAIDGARSDEISTRNIAVEAHVPVNELRTLLEAVQPQQPQVNISLARAAQQDDDRQRAEMQAELNHMALARAEIERTNRIAQEAVARISQPVSPIQEIVQHFHQVVPAPPPAPSVTNVFHHHAGPQVDARQVAIDARQVGIQNIDARAVAISNTHHNTLQNFVTTYNTEIATYATQNNLNIQQAIRILWQRFGGGDGEEELPATMPGDQPPPPPPGAGAIAAGGYGPRRPGRAPRAIANTPYTPGPPPPPAPKAKAKARPLAIEDIARPTAPEQPSTQPRPPPPSASPPPAPRGRSGRATGSASARARTRTPAAAPPRSGRATGGGARGATRASGSSGGAAPKRHKVEIYDIST